MHLFDLLRLTLGSITARRKRSALTMLAIGIGIAAVVMLTSLGQGVHRFVLSEFTQFGTNLLGIVPGRTTTMGVSGAVISNIHPLTIEDADALQTIPGVLSVTPVVQGNARVEYGKTSRRAMVLGVGSETREVYQINVSIGRFLPRDDSITPRAFVVLGHKMRQELFPRENPLGKKVRVAGESYRVVGVLESKGQMLGFDLDDTIYIPTARALALFNRESLMEIDVLYQPGLKGKTIAERVRKRLIERHGDEDFTVVTQQEMLNVLSGILNILTLAVAAIGGISLVVGAIGILTIMTIAVNERTSEIGLLRALGATRGQVRWLFIGEAVFLALLGGCLGLILGLFGAFLIGSLSPVPADLSWKYILMAEVLAAIVGILAGMLPARHAADMNPVDALRTE